MAQSDSNAVKATMAIPWIQRLLVTTFEPLFALSGSILVCIKPEQYLSSLTRGQGAATYHPSQQWVYTQLAGGWLVIVFLEAVILRLVDDLRLWRLICLAILLSDALYTHSCAQAVGGWGEWLNIAHWTIEDWTVTITTWPFVFSRIAIVLGLGIRGGGRGKNKHG